MPGIEGKVPGIEGKMPEIEGKMPGIEGKMQGIDGKMRKDARDRGKDARDRGTYAPLQARNVGGFTRMTQISAESIEVKFPTYATIAIPQHLVHHKRKKVTKN